MTTQSTYKDVMMKVVNPDGTAMLDDASLAALSASGYGPSSVVAVIGPADSANFNDAADAADAAAVAAGGGVIYVTDGSYTLTRPMPTLKSGVKWMAQGAVPATEIGVNASWGVRLIAATPGAYDCFTDGRTDAGAPGNGTPDVYTGSAVIGFYIDGFKNGIKTGALYRFGMFSGEISHNNVVNCTEWGYWAENFFHLEFNTNRANKNGLGQMAFVASAHYNTGNSYIHSLNAGSTTERKSRGMVFMTRGNVVSAGSLNDIRSTKLVSVMGTNDASPHSANVTPVTNGGTLINVSASDIAEYYVNCPVYITASANGLTANRTYFVRTIDTGANQITLSNYPDGGYASSTALVTSGTTTMALKFAGAPNLEIVGSPQAGIQPSTFDGINLESGGHCRVLVYKANQITIDTQLCNGGALAEFVLRDATPIVRTAYDQTRRDFDTLSKDTQWFGRVKSIASVGGQTSVSTKGLYRVNDAAANSNPRHFPSALTLSLGGVIPEIYVPPRSTGVGIVGMLQLWHNQFNGGAANVGGGPVATLMTSGGTYTIPASSDSALPFNLGEFMCVSNPQAAACTLTSADSLRFIGKGASGSSYSLPALTNCILVLQKDGTGLYWAVY